jgi:hypothetical protein
MIFVVETEERTLYVFPAESEAIAYCEGLDVEAAIWLFGTMWGSHLPLNLLFRTSEAFSAWLMEIIILCQRQSIIMLI